MQTFLRHLNRYTPLQYLLPLVLLTVKHTRCENQGLLFLSDNLAALSVCQNGVAKQIHPRGSRR